MRGELEPCVLGSARTARKISHAHGVAKDGIDAPGHEPLEARLSSAATGWVGTARESVPVAEVDIGRDRELLLDKIVPRSGGVGEAYGVTAMTVGAELQRSATDIGCEKIGRDAPVE